MDYLLPTVATKEAVVKLILRFGRATDPACLQQDDILAKFATIALIDVDAANIQAYVKYFDTPFIPTTIFSFNAEHMKMDSCTPDHSKWIGAFHTQLDFIDVVQTILRGAMKGKYIVTCPNPVERIPKFQLFYKEI